LGGSPAAIIAGGDKGPTGRPDGAVCLLACAAAAVGTEPSAIANTTTRRVTGRKRMRISLNMLPPLEQKFMAFKVCRTFSSRWEALTF
jgi:hypothetical protein